ncbi:MAG: hypothetical protein DRN71_03730 [Candidatus Nanohalarchaeota archaeon]|nr:MAG: hypothetical protein DRN71_03730 [Candidatus Nanohaloarchaeota archaeon]
MGKEYLKSVAGQVETVEDVQQIEGAHGSTEEEDPQTEYICVDASDDSCDTLYSAVLGEFDDCVDDSLLKLNINGTKYPVLYTSLGKRESYSGAVYVRISDENAYCAGYVNESDKLIISPEGMYALLVKGNVDNIRNLSMRKVTGVFDGLTGTFRDMMGDEMRGVAMQMKDGIYRNVRELASGKGHLKPDGQLFVAALSELFERERISLLDGADKREIVPDPEFDISKYIPRNDVEPEDNPPDSPENPQGGKMTLADKQHWLKEQGL